MNKVILIGRITKDLELRYTSNNKPVCEFTLAVNRDKDNADFINCIVWNKLAENLTKYQGKGSQIGLSGELRIDTYEVDDKRRYKTYVLVNGIEYLSKNESKEEKPETNPFEEFGNSITTESQIGEQIQIDDEELPF